MSKQKKRFNPNGESTSTVAEVSYDFEKVMTGTHKYKSIEDLLASIVRDDGFPPHLQYIDSFYDPKTGVAGCAFLDTRTGQMIIGYPGTNVKADGWKDIATDLSIVGGSQKHVSEAVKFYERLAEEGYPIVLTGHSLGGNIAALVALITNNPTTVTYNGAPISVDHLLEFFERIFGSSKALTILALLFGLTASEQRNKLNELIDNFSGNIIRFVSEKDILNNGVGLVDALYVGSEYVIYNKNPHDMSYFLNEDIQLYLSKIIDMEQHKIVYENIGVDVDGDGKVDITRSAKQLVVKNLLGMPIGNVAANGKKF